MGKSEEPIEGAPPDERDASRSQSAGFLAGIVCGALVGASLALLFAPDRGDAMRRRIRHRLQRLGEESRDGVDDLKGRARSEMLRRRRLREGLEGGARKAKLSLDDVS